MIQNYEGWRQKSWVYLVESSCRGRLEDGAREYMCTFWEAAVELAIVECDESSATLSRRSPNILLRSTKLNLRAVLWASGSTFIIPSLGVVQP